ncbi:MAG: CoA-binding protein, partial [Pararhizobium sp.]
MNSMVWSRNNNQLDSFFKPRSVAVLGASADIEKTGGRTLANLLSSGYAGKVYPINPRGGEIQGLKTYSALGEVGAPIDLVINCLPGTQFDDVVTTAIELKVKAMITFASGFAEQSHEGLLRQEAIIKRLRDGGVSLVGPNCLGVLDGVNGLAASSSVFLRELDVVAGGLSMATMSGALGVYWLDEVLRAGLGVSKWVATGNEGDVTLSDVLNYLVDDTDTKVICLYVEGIKLGHDFRTGLYRAAAANKPVIVLRSGRSSVGAKAIASHTGALAGEDVLYRTLFEQSGVCQVDSLSEMVDVARIFVTQNVAPKRKAAIISISGGAAALA